MNRLHKVRSGVKTDSNVRIFLMAISVVNAKNSRLIIRKIGDFEAGLFR
jgi:hypothetical protein